MRSFHRHIPKVFLLLEGQTPLPDLWLATDIGSGKNSVNSGVIGLAGYQSAQNIGFVAPVTEQFPGSLASVRRAKPQSAALPYHRRDPALSVVEPRYRNSAARRAITTDSGHRRHRPSALAAAASSTRWRWRPPSVPLRGLYIARVCARKPQDGASTSHIAEISCPVLLWAPTQQSTDRATSFAAMEE